jgi:hypothetical protein
MVVRWGVRYLIAKIIPKPLMEFYSERGYEKGVLPAVVVCFGGDWPNATLPKLPFDLNVYFFWVGVLRVRSTPSGIRNSMRDSFDKVEAEDLCKRRPDAVIAKIIVGPVVSFQVMEEGSKKAPSRPAILILAGVRLARFRRASFETAQGQ